MKLSISECENLTQIIVCDNMYRTQQNFDRLMRQLNQYVSAFSKYYLSDIIDKHYEDNELLSSCYKKTNVHKILTKLLNNSSVVVKQYKHEKTEQTTYVFVNKDYNRQLQDLCRMTVIKYSSERQINKRLVRDNIVSQSEVDRKPLRYDRIILSVIQKYLRELEIIITIHSGTKIFYQMMRSKQVTSRLNRKKLKRQIATVKHDTRDLMTKLNLC